LFADQLGSTNATSDPNGLMVGLGLYKPWGESRGGAGISLTDYAFTGQCKNIYIKLVRFGSRWYDTQLHVVDGLAIGVEVGVGLRLCPVHPEGEHAVVRAAAGCRRLPVRFQVVGGVGDGNPVGGRPASPGQHSRSHLVAGEGFAKFDALLHRPAAIQAIENVVGVVGGHGDPVGFEDVLFEILHFTHQSMFYRLLGPIGSLNLNTNPRVLGILIPLIKSINAHPG
jgi:hypothetical protein